MDTTRELIDRLKISSALRRICGWQKACDVPHESSFGFARPDHQDIPFLDVRNLEGCLLAVFSTGPGPHPG